jgi:hypothetical protein
VDDLAVTVISRWDFDHANARILGYGESAIVPESADTAKLRAEILERANQALLATDLESMRKRLA